MARAVPSRRNGLRTAHVLAFALPAFLLAGALGSQFVMGLVPCEMCIWQRWPHVVALLLAGLALAFRAMRGRLLFLAGVAIAISGAIGVYHAGVELGWFAGLTTCATSAGSGLDAIMGGAVVRCDAVQWELLGISMAGWNAIVSLTGAALIFWFLGKGNA